MADTQQTIAELLGPVLDLLLRRDEIGAARDAGSMMFWRDGMRGQLELIANGNCESAVFGELMKGLVDTEDRISGVVERLKTARNRLGGSKLARQIDTIINDDFYGKGNIRMRIADMVRDYDSNEKRTLREDLGHLLTDRAKDILKRIDNFNMEIERLNRMVRGGV